jgi:hypothetical protein
MGDLTPEQIQKLKRLAGHEKIPIIDGLDLDEDGPPKSKYGATIRIADYSGSGKRRRTIGHSMRFVEETEAGVILEDCYGKRYLKRNGTIRKI